MGTYNGWTNRETWVINLHLGDSIFDIADEATPEFLAELLQDFVYEMLESESINPLFLDLIDLGAVNWREIAEHYLNDIAA